MPEFSFNIDSLVEDTGTGSSTAAPTRSPAPWGVKSAIGERQSMEDSWCVQLPLAPLSANNNQEAAAAGTSSGREAEGTFVSYEDLTFFAVYDGHGGSEVAQFCAENLHKRFAEQLSASSSKGSGLSDVPNGAAFRPQQVAGGTAEGSSQADALTQQGASVSCSESADQTPLTPDSQASGMQAMGQFSDSTELVCSALRAAFNLVDSSLAGTETGDYVGATAVVAVLGKTHIWIAHCGECPSSGFSATAALG